MFLRHLSGTVLLLLLVSACSLPPRQPDSARAGQPLMAGGATPVAPVRPGSAGSVPGQAGGTGSRGAADRNSITLSLVYPPALHLNTAAPGTAPVVVRFSAPVERSVAEASLTVRPLVEGSERSGTAVALQFPPLAGTFSWVDDLTLLFRPLTSLAPGPYQVGLEPVPAGMRWLFPGEGQRFVVGSGENPAPLVRFQTFDAGPIAMATEYLGISAEALSSPTRAIHQGNLIYVLDNHPLGLVAIFDEPTGRFLGRIIPPSELTALDGRTLDLAVSPEGLIYLLVGGDGPGFLYRFQRSGLWDWMTEVRGGADRAVVSGPWVYLHGRSGTAILMLDRQTGQMVESNLTLPEAFVDEAPEGIAAGPDGTLFVIGWGRLYQFAPDGGILWTYDHRVMRYEDPDGDENLHNLLGSKSGSGYPTVLLPSNNGGVWVQDTRWFKEFLPGEGLVSKRKPGALVVGVCPVEGGFYVQEAHGLGGYQPEGRHRLLGNLSSGPGGFEGASLVTAFDGGFYLYDRLTYTLRRYGLDGTPLGEPVYGLDRLHLSTDRRLWTARGQTSLQPLNGSGPPVTLEGAMTHWKLLPTPEGFWGLVSDHEAALWNTEGKLVRQWHLPESKSTIYVNSAISMLPDGRAAVLQGATVYLIDPKSGQITSWGTPGTELGRLGLRVVEDRLRYEYGPGGIAATPGGLLIIADHLNGALKAFTASGSLLWWVELPAGPAALRGVERLIMDARGALWAIGGNRLVRYDLR